MNAEMPPDFWSSFSWEVLLKMDWTHVAETVLSNFLTYVYTFVACCAAGFYRFVFRRQAGEGAVRPKEQSPTNELPSSQPRPTAERHRSGGATLWQIAYLVKLGMPESQARELMKEKAGSEIARRIKQRGETQPPSGKRKGNKK